MKTLIGLLTFGLITTLGTQAADARPRGGRTYVEYHRSCGGPAYVETYVAYFDRCGHPVYRTRVIPIRHHRHHRPVPYRGHSVHYRSGSGLSIHFNGGYR